MLSIGAALLGASHVLGIDLDADALDTARENCEAFEDLPVSAGPDSSKHTVPLVVLLRTAFACALFARLQFVGCLPSFHLQASAV